MRKQPKKKQEVVKEVVKVRVPNEGSEKLGNMRRAEEAHLKADEVAYSKFLHKKSKERRGGQMFRVLYGKKFVGNYWGRSIKELREHLVGRKVNHSHVIALA